MSRQVYDSRRDERVERGCFCFVSNVPDPDLLRRKTFPAADWTNGYLRIAEGWDVPGKPWKVVRF